jgi:hypothetical protein
MKFQESSLKKVRNLVRIKDNIINYLIERNNEAELIYFRENKEKQEKFLNALKNIGSNSGIQKMKSLGPFGFNMKFHPEKGLANTGNKHEHDKNKVKNKFLLSYGYKKLSLKKMKSSFVQNDPVLDIPVNANQKIYNSKSNILQVKKRIPRIKSLDDRTLIASKERKKIYKINNDLISKMVKRKHSDKLLKGQLVNKIKEILDK